MLESNADEENWVNFSQAFTSCVTESVTNTVKSCSMDTHLKQTPVDNGHFCLSQQIAHYFLQNYFA